MIETSLWMHHDRRRCEPIEWPPIAPQRVVNHDVVPIDTRMSTASGSLSSPMGASADIGQLLTQWLVERVVNVIDDEFPRASSARKGQ